MSRCAFFLCFFFLLLPLGSIENTNARPADDAATELVKKYGCDQVKGWAMGGVDNALAVWAKYIISGFDDRIIDEIIERGVIGDVLEHGGSIMTMITALDEAATGDLWKAAEIAGGGAWDMQLSILAGPHAAAVWTVCKVLNDIAVELTKEIVYLNLETGANWAEKDVALLGPARVDYFLDNYLKWDDRSPYELNTRVRQFRTMFYEYIREDMGQSDFPDVNDWPANKNRVRVAAAAMLNDISLIVKGREQQKILGEKLAALRAEMAVIQNFQSWWAMVKGITCTEDIAEAVGDAYGGCLNGTEMAAGILAEAEQLFGEIDYTADIRTLQNRITQQERQIDQRAGQLEKDLAFISSLCQAEQEEWDGGMSLVERTEQKVGILEALTGSVSTSTERACAAQDYSTADAHASRAEVEARKAEDIRADILSDRTSLSAWEAPPETDFDDLLAFNDDAYLNFRKMKRDAEKMNTEIGRIQELLLDAGMQLRRCDSWLASVEVERNERLQSLIQDYKGRRARIQTELDLRSLPSNEYLQSMDERLVSNESFILEQIERQKAGRTCLEQLPEIHVLLSRMEVCISKAADLTIEAQKQARRARSCAEVLAAGEEVAREPGIREESTPAEESATWTEVSGGATAQQTNTNASSDSSEPRESPEAGGWVAVGEARTVVEENRTVQPSEGRTRPVADNVPSAGTGTQASGWIRAAEDAFSACNFEVARQYADWLAAAQPAHPWLTANHRTIINNAERQREALSILRQAQNNLQSPDLEIADLRSVRQSIDLAAQIAPNCMVDLINDALGDVSTGIEEAKARDRAEVASALGGLIATMTTVATMVQTAPPAVAPPVVGRTSGNTRPSPVTGVATPPPSGSPPAAGSPCSVNVASAPYPEDEIRYWALVEFPAPGNPHIKNYLILPVAEGHSLNEALASLAAGGAQGRQVGTGTLVQMKSLARQHCPNPAGYIEH
jgi:hypothetical protein